MPEERPTITTNLLAAVSPELSEKEMHIIRHININRVNKLGVIKNNKTTIRSKITQEEATQVKIFVQFRRKGIQEDNFKTSPL